MVFWWTTWKKSTWSWSTWQQSSCKSKIRFRGNCKWRSEKIKVKKHIVCDTCSGIGAKDSSSYQTCNTCNGSGVVRKVTSTFLGQMQTTGACPTCEGEGKIITNKCTKCRGEGRVYGEEVVSIDIPAGVSEGIQLSMNGKGMLVFEVVLLVIY
ncbi:MAG: hypothetical protein IPL21_09740 [Saprospirales bacterium]|nr:hypothetical protein [Saprospirales bacterium]